MSNYVKLAAEAGDKYLTALAEFQDSFLKSFTTGAERIKAATAAVATPAFDLPTPIPTAQEVSDANFAFAQKLLKQQKTFVEKLFATSAPTIN